MDLSSSFPTSLPSSFILTHPVGEIVGSFPFVLRSRVNSSYNLRFHFSGSPPMANLYRSREGLSARPAANSDEIQLRIDPVHADLDEEITGLHKKVTMLKTVAQEIESEAKFQNDYISQLQMTLSKTQAGLKNNMKRLNRAMAQKGSNHVLHVVLFGLACFSVVYLWSKHLRR